MRHKIKQVNDTTYCLYYPPYFNCTYVITAKDDAYLIDTGTRSDAKDVKFAFETIGMPIQNLKGILLTHWHNDHSAGTAELKNQTNCVAYCHEKEMSYFHKRQKSKIRQLARLIPEMGPLILLKGLLGDIVPRQAQIDHAVQDGDLLYNRFEVIHTPGHTPGHTAYYDKISKTLFAGDCLAVVDQRLRLMGRWVTPDKKSSLESIVKVLQNREIITLCPGHRQPLLKNVDMEIDRFIPYTLNLKRWPFFG